MDKTIINSIIDIYFNDCHDTIDRNESLNKFYHSFKKDEFNVLNIYLLLKDDVCYLEEVPYRKENKKEDKINYLLEHSMEIYQTLLCTMDDSCFKQLQRLIKKNGYCDMIADADYLEYSINFINMLKNIKLAKINYQSSSQRIKIFIPKDLLKIIQRIICQKEFKEKRKYISIVQTNVTKILHVYGLLSVNKLYQIMNLVFEKIDRMKFETYLRMITVLNEQLHLFGDGNDDIITNMDFENAEEAYTYYYSLSDGDYKIFTKEEYDELSEGVYHQKFDVYQSLITYLVVEMNFDIDALDMFENWFILDYLSSYQEDISLANENLNINLKKFFPNLKIQDKIIIKKKLSDLGNLYPIYSLKGYSVVEDKLK